MLGFAAIIGSLFLHQVMPVHMTISLLIAVIRIHFGIHSISKGVWKKDEIFQKNDFN